MFLQAKFPNGFQGKNIDIGGKINVSGGGWVFTIYVSFDRSRPGGVEK